MPKTVSEMTTEDIDRYIERVKLGQMSPRESQEVVKKVLKFRNKLNGKENKK